MNDTEYAPEHDRRAHMLLERHLVVGAHTYLITASGTGDDTIRLCLTGRDPAGATVGQITGGIPPADLPSVSDAFNAVLAGLVAMRRPGRSTRTAAGDQPKAHPKRGTRWSAEDDKRLLTRYGEGAGEKTLADEFGRSRGGIRARLEGLGAIEPGARLHYRDRLSGAGTSGSPGASGGHMGGDADSDSRRANPDAGAGRGGDPAPVVPEGGERRMPRLIGAPPESDWSTAGPADVVPRLRAAEDTAVGAAPEEVVTESVAVRGADSTTVPEAAVGSGAASRAAVGSSAAEETVADPATAGKSAEWTTEE